MTEQQQFAAAMELVDRALDASTTERAQILASCVDSDVRARAKKLLDADAAAGDFLEKPAYVARVVVGDRIGSFQLREVLGRGGMGEVWLAERVDADFAQRVAIKLLPTAEDDDAAARFRHERRVLASLDHPRIAKLLDGGVTKDGRPWLAMELVEGRDLLTACAGLTLEAKLALFAEICDVVQAAHRSLVIHRDLKPSNILVTADGAPKLLDFGIAKLIAGDGSDPGLTRTTDRPMTLHYASPEQIRGGAITIASDVWSLGVILHEILVGERPYTGTNRIETEAKILAAVPARPSSKVDRARARELRGDLDAIVMKALRAAPTDRYASAEALGQDVRHHLSRSPVSARGDATGYLLRAMVRRHRAGFAVAALAIVLLVAGIAGTAWQARRAREQSAKTARVNQLVVGMLESFDPSRVASGQLDRRQILERNAAQLSNLADDPEAQARLLVVFAQTWLDLRDQTRAMPLAERAVVIERAFDPHGMNLAKALEVRGNIWLYEAELEHAAHDFGEAMEIATSVEGGAGLDVATLLNDLASVQRQYAGWEYAEEYRRRALAIVTGWRGPGDPQAIRILDDLAVLLGDEGRYAESRVLQRQACDALAHRNGANHPELLICRGNIARDDLETGQFAVADRELAAVIRDETTAFGSDWSEIPPQLVLRARALDGLGRGDEALAMIDDAIARIRHHFGEDAAEITIANIHRVRLLVHLGRAIEAEPLARASLDICMRELAFNLVCEGKARYALALALESQGQIPAARDELTKAIDLETPALGTDHPDYKAAVAELKKLSR